MMSKKEKAKKNWSGVDAGSLPKHSPQSTSYDNYPFVSVVTPTCNRRHFLPWLLYMFQYQDYPSCRRELVIFDDSPMSNADLIANLIRCAPNPELIRYYHQTERLTIGKKRNILNQLAEGEYIVCMDDDDYYPPDKLSYTISEMQRHQVSFAGCDAIPIWYSSIDRVFMTSPLGKNNAVNGTFAYHRRFLSMHRYDDKSTTAEESGFLNGFTVPVLQLDPWRSILCISHNSNTYDKDFIFASCKLQSTTLSDIVTDNSLLRHYQRLHSAPIGTRIDWSPFDRICLLPSSGNAGQTQDFYQQLIALGVSPQQLWTLPVSDPADPFAAHQAVLERAITEKWNNYLILDDRLKWVRQEKSLRNANQLIHALPHIDWQGILLAGDLAEGIPLRQLPCAVKPTKIGLTTLAYAVNQTGYHTYKACLEQAKEEQSWDIVAAWIGNDRWFALYPSLFWLEQDDTGSDCAARFFRKLARQDSGRATG